MGKLPDGSHTATRLSEALGGQPLPGTPLTLAGLSPEALLISPSHGQRSTGAGVSSCFGAHTPHSLPRVRAPGPPNIVSSVALKP